jgi:DNA repair exonuclease SbcCD nuclease subunit
MPKYISTSDWHLRSSSPQYRIDDYEETLLRKIRWIVRTANKYNASILIAGDIADNIKVSTFPTRLINRLTVILKLCRLGIYAIPGQHDLEYHNNEDLISTPFFNLVQSKSIISLSSTPINNIYGIPWNMDLPENVPTNEHSILVMHYTVTDGDPAFFLQETGMSSSDLLSNFPEFKFIVCGDYHSPHVTTIDGRTVINCGSIARSSKDQYDFEPRIYLLDTDKSEVTPLFIPIEPPEDVFNIPKNDKDENDIFISQIDEIVKSLSNNGERPDFKTTVRLIMKGKECSKQQLDIAEKFLREN